jgi:hypothetical protein
MPMFNWRRCLEHGQLEYCRKNLDEGEEKDDEKSYELIYDSYLKEFGLGKEYENLLELKREKALLECDFVLTDDRFILNRIRQIEFELEDMAQDKHGMDMDTVIIYIEKWRGFEINEHTITVKKFYKLLNAYLEYNNSKK